MDKDDKEKIKEVRRAAEKPVECGTRDEELVVSLEKYDLSEVIIIDEENTKEEKKSPVEWGTRDEELVLSVEAAGLELVYLEKIDEEDEKGEKASTERGSMDESFVDNIEKTEDPKRKN